MSVVMKLPLLPVLVRLSHVSNCLKLPGLFAKLELMLCVVGSSNQEHLPTRFKGLGEDGLELVAEARQLTGMPVVVEITSITQLDIMIKYVDVIQIGARNMQNFALLSAIGKTQTPVLLKRGMSATIEELLMASEYILSGGNQRVMLCERGIRTFETATRNTTDINAIPVLKALDSFTGDTGSVAFDRTCRLCHCYCPCGDSGWSRWVDC